MKREGVLRLLDVEMDAPAFGYVRGCCVRWIDRLQEDHKELYLVLFISGNLTMRYSTRIRPISYLKANAAEVLRQLTEQRELLLITQNGEVKAVIQDVASFEQTKQTLASLKILALGNRQIEEGKTVRAEDAIRRLREKSAARKTPA